MDTAIFMQRSKSYVLSYSTNARGFHGSRTQTSDISDLNSQANCILFSHKKAASSKCLYDSQPPRLATNYHEVCFVWIIVRKRKPIGREIECSPPVNFISRTKWWQWSMLRRCRNICDAFRSLCDYWANFYFTSGNRKQFLFTSFSLFWNRISQETRTSAFSVITRKLSVVSIRNQRILKIEITVEDQQCINGGSRLYAGEEVERVLKAAIVPAQSAI